MYTCAICDYKTENKFNYSKHLNTRAATIEVEKKDKEICMIVKDMLKNGI